jgi:hypothetical protein
MTDDALWDAFSRAAIPEKEWNHRAHLRVAWLFTRRHALDEAHLLMRVGIIRMNATHGLVETPARGYHETITRAWLILMRAWSADHPTETSVELLDLLAERAGREALLRHYTRERLLGVEARARWVPPDLDALP